MHDITGRPVVDVSFWRGITWALLLSLVVWVPVVILVSGVWR